MPLPLRRPGKKDRGRGHYENRLALAVSLPVEGFSRGHCFDASRLSTPRSSNEFCSRPSSVCRWSLQETSGGCARRRLAMNCGLQTNHNHAPPNLSPPSHPPHEPVACGQHSFATTHLAPRERETLKKTSEPHSSMPAFRSDNFSGTTIDQLDAPGHIETNPRNKTRTNRRHLSNIGIATHQQAVGKLVRNLATQGWRVPAAP